MALQTLFFWGERKTEVPWEKPALGAESENQQTQPTHDAESENKIEHGPGT